MAEFTVYPALDLRGGQVVRLEQGDPHRQTVYGIDPAAIAEEWLDCGAGWLHVVNLDGAFGEQDQANQAALRSILQVAATHVPPAKVQFGGGLRSLEDIDQALALGVSRVILGTAAIEIPGIFAGALRQHGAEAIGLAIDVRRQAVQVRGWTQAAKLPPLTLGMHWASLGLRIAVYTDVHRDGMSQGVNVRRAKGFAKATGLAIIAAGGVSSLADVRRVRLAGLSGVIIGRALLDGSIDLSEVLAC